MRVQLQYDFFVTKFKVFEGGEMIYESVIKAGIDYWEIYELHDELRNMEISDAEISQN